MKYWRLSTFIIPLYFCLISFLYKDSFYLMLAGITFLFAILIILPKFLADKKISFHLNKKRGQKNHHDIGSFAKKMRRISIKKHEVFILILVSTLIFIAFFTHTAVNSLKTIPSVKNLILEYYISQIFSIKQTWIYLVILLVVLALLAPNIKIKKKSSKFTFKFNLPLFIKHLIFASFALIFAFILSFLLVYLYGMAQLNIAVIKLKFFPGAVGVIYGKDAVNNRLKSTKTVPQVIGSEKDTSSTILSVVVRNGSKQDSYYQSRILKSIPHSIIMPFDLSSQSIVMVNNTLIINSIDKDTIETISPALAHLLLKRYFKDRDLKGDPTISILNRQEYLAFRQDQINKQVVKIKVVIQKVEDYINTLYGDIANAKQKIAANQSAIDYANSAKSSAYSNCISLGYYSFFTGVFYHYYTQDECNTQGSQYDSYIAQYQQNINDWNNTLQYDQNELAQAQTADQNLKDYADSVDAMKNSTPEELGIFEGPKHVRVVLDSTSAKGINAFLETLVHENLHYQSYVSEDRNFQFTDGTYDGFWEEGLTEYFARRVMATDLGVNVNQGYPLIVKIIAQFTKKIPESDLARIYFTKDESALEASLNAAYGKNFYKNTEPYFEYLSYLPEDKQLKYANNIITVIRGKQLITNDLYSTDMQMQ